MKNKRITVDFTYKIKFNYIEDQRGVLTSIEESESVPFQIKRVFYMHHIRADRGGHSHIDTDQVIIPLKGNFNVSVKDGNNEKNFHLNNCNEGLYIPRRLFTCLYNFDFGDVCLVLANTHYNIANSQRTWDDFIDMKEKTENA